MSADGRLAQGELLAGYRVERLIGQGGMGEVYRAHDPRLDRPVALKLLAARLSDDEGFRERLLRESRLAASLDHPNVVPIYESGEDRGRLFIAMRYVEGTDLKALLRAEGVLSPQRVVAIGAQIADALDSAHARGLVHRDVKPSNVLIDQAGGREHPYLADFGLTQSASASDLGDGQLMGTLEYVAPEQIRGDELDGRADVYALGCLLFEALTGTLPFAGVSDVALVFAHLEGEPPRASDRRPELPGAVDQVLARAMAKAPAERPPTCRALIDELEDALGLRPSARDRLRARLPALGIVAVIAATALTLVIALLTAGGAPATTPEGSVVHIDPATNTVAARYPLGADPGPVVAGSGRVWVVSFFASTLWQLDPVAGEATRVAALGKPFALGIEGDTVYVASDDASLLQQSLTPYDLATGQRREGISATVCAVAGGPGIGLAISACPFVVGLDDRAGGIRTTWQTFIPLAEPRTTETSRACGCSMAVGFGDLWVAGDPADARVWRLDRRGNIVAVIALPFGPREIAAGEGAVWATDPLGDRVARIDPRTNRVTDTLDAGRGAGGVAAGADGIWIADAIAGTLTRIDPATRRTVATIVVGGAPREVAVDGDAVWVTVDDA